MKETWLARLWMVASSIAVAVSMGIAAPGVAAEIDGRCVMELERARDDGDDRVQDMQMILIDKKGNQRKRSIRSYSKDVGDDDYSILFLLSPPDVRETGFLTYDYDDDDRDDDQWLYLPALKKGKRNKYLEVKKLDQIDGVWVATETHMTTKQGKVTLHKTILVAKNVRFGEDQGDDHFTTRQLEKGL